MRYGIEREGRHQVQLLSFSREDHASFGAVIEGRVVDLGRHMPEYDSLKALLAANALVKALDTAAEVSPDYRLEKVDLRCPITDAERLLCIFDDARDESVSIDPKFVRGHNRSLLIPTDDKRPVAAGVLIAIKADKDEYAPLGYCLMNYLSPAALAAGPWLTTPDELPDTLDMTLAVSAGEGSAELRLPDPTEVALEIAREKSLATGDLVAILHFLPELNAGTGDSLSVETEILGTLSNPIAPQPS